jgi:radical SAM protein with 4Fe4S-binding SPASM domain
MHYVPTHVQIETVNRFCDARCPMCTIKFVPDFAKDAPDELSWRGVARKAEIMTLETFQKITDKFKPLVSRINFLSLHGCGEPLLDKTLPEKVNHARRQVGFKNVGFTSNCSFLREDLAKRLLDAGLTTIIPSIDGLTAEVHETIRPRTKFNVIRENVERFIRLRDQGGYECKVLVRMIKQQLNIAQWNDYRTHWLALMNPQKGDAVLGFDVHNNGGKVKDFDKMTLGTYSETKRAEFDKHLAEDKVGMCPDLFSRLSIFASGDVALCSTDQSEFFKLGNIVEQDPVEVFNNPKFNEYRQAWIENRYMTMTHCKDCSIAISRVHSSRAQGKAA